MLHVTPNGLGEHSQWGGPGLPTSKVTYGGCRPELGLVPGKPYVNRREPIPPRYGAGREPPVAGHCWTRTVLKNSGTCEQLELTTGRGKW